MVSSRAETCQGPARSCDDRFGSNATVGERRQSLNRPDEGLPEDKPSRAWTPNFESDADVVAPLLAKRSGTAGALYLWLHSRVFCTGNLICVSHGFLAGRLGVGVTSIKRALASLEDAGLIKVSARPGNGGGTRISLTRVHNVGVLIARDRAVREANSGPSNRPDPGYDIYHNTKNEEKDLFLRKAADELLAHLYTSCGAAGRSADENDVHLVVARLEEGFPPDVLKSLVSEKCSQWVGTDRERFLVPATLFDRETVREYVNQEK